MSQTTSSTVTTDPESSGRRPLSRRPLLRRLLLRPELTAVVGSIGVFVLFSILATNSGFLSRGGALNWLEVAAEVGIIAIPVTLLLIAGDFDLSVGATVGLSSIAFAYATANWHFGVLPALVFTLGLASVIGLVNGLLVTRTPVPSFIVTLATQFIISGGTVAVTQKLTGGSTEIFVSNLPKERLSGIFDGKLLTVPAELWWWGGLTIIGAIVLDNTRFGNWIYASGGGRVAAQKLGVPVPRVKITLYVCAAMAAALVGIFETYAVNVADTTNGLNKELEAIAAAVIGGAMITGGFGTVIGTAVGATLFGMVDQGFYFTSINQVWYEPFVGVVLLVAVLINLYTQRLALVDAFRARKRPEKGP